MNTYERHRCPPDIMSFAVVTDKLRIYPIAHREIIPEAIHDLRENS
jgi:hypothetical protein